MGIAKLYLFVYNIISCISWAWIFYTSLYMVINGTRTWHVIQIPLKIAQSAAILEIAHSAFGLVRSPVITTFMQGKQKYKKRYPFEL